MKGGIRQSMAWLHTWSGLLLGWLLFAIFVTGTIAYFRSEVTYWMQPELHVAMPGEHGVAHALSRLQSAAPDAERWQLSLPDERRRTIGLVTTGGSNDPGLREEIDPASGAVLHPRETAGGNFLYRFHFELYAMPRDPARWIVGIATMLMFVSIIGGIILHKRIFADFFTFRPGKGQRSWLDAHTASSVLALPFHLMITYSGLLLLASTLIPWNAGDVRGSRDRSAPEQVESTWTGQAPTVAVLAAIMADAESHWGMPPGRVTVHHPGRSNLSVEVAPKTNRALVAASGSGSIGVERRFYDGRTGLPTAERGVPEQSAAQDTFNAFGTLHRARFAGTTLRWLFFVAGVVGTVMVGTGLVLWVKKRVKNAPPTIGQRLVMALNVSGIAGLFVAVGAYFWANRLLPVEIALRSEWEVRLFFAAWLVCIAHAFLRAPRQAWVEQLALAAFAIGALPVLNAVTSPSSLPDSLARGDYLLAGFDLVALASGAALGYCAYRVQRTPARGVRRRDRAAAQASLAGAAAEVRQ